MSKITIGLCDDNPMALNRLEKIIGGYLKEKKKPVHLMRFSSGSELLSCPDELDILFLDIEMPGEDGIKTGRILRERGSQCRIIMATSMVERFKEGFHIGAVRFVTKPFEEAEVYEALEYALQTVVGLNTIELYKNRILHRIEERKIRYIQAYDGYAEALIEPEGIRMRTEKSLNHLEEELDGRLFYRVNREYLVNFAFIQAYEKGEILIGTQRIRVSRRNRKDFERAYREYDLTCRG